MGEISQLAERLVEPVAEIVQPGPDRVVLPDQLPGARELDPEGGEVLLRPVVEIALHPVALELAGGRRART